MPCPGRRPSRTDSYLVTRQRARTHRWRLCWSGVLRDSGSRPASPRRYPPCSKPVHPHMRLSVQYTSGSARGSMPPRPPHRTRARPPPPRPARTNRAGRARFRSPTSRSGCRFPIVSSSVPNAAGSAVDSPWTLSRASTNTSRESRRNANMVSAAACPSSTSGTPTASTSSMTASVASVTSPRNPTVIVLQGIEARRRIEVGLKIRVQSLDVIDPSRDRAAHAGRVLGRGDGVRLHLAPVRSSISA